MKTNTLLFLVSLAVLATNARAASSQTADNVVVLPAYQVNAPRYQPSEKKVNASLDELRRQASAPIFLATELPAFKAIAAQPGLLEQVAKDARALRVAKL